MRRGAARRPWRRRCLDGEVVDDHDIAARKRRGELGLDVGVEGGAVDRAVDHPGRHQAIGTQPGDEGLRAPLRMGSTRAQPLPPASAAAKARHLGVEYPSGDGRLLGWR